MSDRDDNFSVEATGDTVAVELEYPRHGVKKFVQVGLMDVRAADCLRITYDFDRDGWSIMQASRFAWSVDDDVCDPDWKEVEFILSWGRAESEAEQEARLFDAGG